MIGQTILHYKILKKLGEGGMSVGVIILFILVLFPKNHVISQVRESTGDSSVVVADTTQNIFWINCEFGNHSQELDEETIGSGTYQRISLELPISIYLILDRLQYNGTFHNNYGIGIHFRIARLGQFECVGAPLIYRDSYWGLQIPATVAFIAYNNTIRLQTTISYRTGGNIDPGGARGHQFFTFSFGLGFSLNYILPKNANS